jgi:hypothetical protein
MRCIVVGARRFSERHYRMDVMFMLVFSGFNRTNTNIPVFKDTDASFGEFCRKIYIFSTTGPYTSYACVDGLFDNWILFVSISAVVSPA